MDHVHRAHFDLWSSQYLSSCRSYIIKNPFSRHARSFHSHGPLWAKMKSEQQKSTETLLRRAKQWVANGIYNLFCAAPPLIHRRPSGVASAERAAAASEKFARIHLHTRQIKKRPTSQPTAQPKASRENYSSMAVYIMIAIFFPSHFSARAQMQTQS